MCGKWWDERNRKPPQKEKTQWLHLLLVLSRVFLCGVPVLVVSSHGALRWWACWGFQLAKISLLEEIVDTHHKFDPKVKHDPEF